MTIMLKSTFAPVIASLRSDLISHTLRLLHCVRNDNTFLLSSRACEAISSLTPLRLLHCVRNDNTFLLSSRVYEAIFNPTPPRLLHYVRNDNNAEIHLYPCHREFTKRSQVLRSRDCFTAFAMTIPSYYYREPHTPVIASWRSDLKCCTPEIASLRSQ
jgi:hypothetical protein